MKRILAVAAAAAGLLVSTGQAAGATAPDDPAAQAAGQAAASGQAAGALSGASQSQPANRNISVRVLSPGDNGDVTQSNTVSSNATAANANLTSQDADQTQSGSCGCAGGIQAIGQEADNDQSAKALSLATQHGASNTNIPVRVLSPGDNGSVSQTNSVDSDATAANLNATSQDADQEAGGSGLQAIGQEADSEQDAFAASKAEQAGAKNTNISVRVLSPGDDGSVDQSNSVDSSATAANLNLTKQDADQDQGGSGGVQAIGQEADSDQKAAALSLASQKDASNTNIPVRVLSKGDNGDVEQSNSVDSSATAANLNALKQDADQDQGGKGKDDKCCESGGIQAIGQEAKNDQDAVAASAAFQKGASNTNTPVRVGSKGDDGDVDQTNSVDSDATALNVNLTKQDADQEQGGGKDHCCPSDGIQAIGQEAKSDQDATAVSLAAQEFGHGKKDCGCGSSGGNVNTPVRVDSKGDGGKVEQSNSVDSDATAANLNALKQDADQDQGGSGGIQAIGQEAKNDQDAFALSLAAQKGASNTNTPVRVDSKGDDGKVEQENSVDSDATAANLNLTKQDADQDQGGKGKDCGCHSDGIQAIGQEAKSEQDATALSAALQSGASNKNTPVRVDSKGHDGKVDQSNSVDSDATALNINLTKQDADQDQSGSGGIQAIGQEAKSDQDATAASLAAQKGASNTNTPVRVDSKGDGGKVDQSNSVDSDATALNLNALKQDADQDQGGKGDKCGCSGDGIQAIGQEAKNEQDATALSAAFQSGASNKNTPVRVDSKGDDGKVEQSNSVDSDATALNINLTKQDADQDQGSGHGKDHCCSSGGIQAIGQEAKSDQDATAVSLAAQEFGHKKDKCGCDSGGNTNTPVRVDSKGDGGKVEQSNSVDSSATAANLNALKQDADQDQSGSGGIQAIGQEADNDQDAFAASLAAQKGASNTNTPVRVDSKGDDGKVDQSNSVDSDATAANLNLTKQDADQDQGGKGDKCGCSGESIQAIGQEAKNEQDATALSAALQFGASNKNTPVRVDSKGDDGDVDQSNSVDSDATALNVNLTKQDADQYQGGSKDCGCHDGIGIQAIGQEAKNDQDAAALSFALQAGASNKNTPVRVDSKGGGGDVDQSNSVDSDATAANLNALEQDADQDQSGGAGIAIQAIGQSAKNEQGALALSAALQFGASNSNTPVAVDSKGGGGDVDQSNSVESDATALNLNLTKQDADQDQGSKRDKECGCHDAIGIQAIGQESKSEQGALAASLAIQAFGHGKCGCPSGGNSEYARGRRQQAWRRRRRPVQQRELVSSGAEPERALPGRGSGSVQRRRDPGDRTVGEEQPVRARPVGGAAVRREERQ